MMTDKKADEAKEAKAPEVKKASVVDKAIAELEALPHLNYKEAKDKLIEILKLIK